MQDSDSYGAPVTEPATQPLIKTAHSSAALHVHGDTTGMGANSGSETFMLSNLQSQMNSAENWRPEKLRD